MRRAVAALFTVCATGCFQSALVPCGDLLCPAGATCVAGELCATTEQVAACVDKSDGTPCLVPGGDGACYRGVCVLDGCGNDVIDLGEVCDDGNRAGGDGCAANCAKYEACDGEPDEGEPCDDGNANPADGCDQCVSTRWIATPRIGGASTMGAALDAPWGISVDVHGNVYIVDSDHGRVLRVDPSGRVTTVAGNGSYGYGGDGGPAASAQLARPQGVAVDGLGNLYVADSRNHRIRRVDADGVISTVAGNGTAGFGGDGAPAVGAMLSMPDGLAVDGLGNLYVADSDNNRVRRIDPSGVISTVVGTGVAGFAGDGGPATDAQLASPHGIALDAMGTLYIADRGNHRIRKVDAAGTIRTVAGDGTLGRGGDGGPATSAQLYDPIGVACDDAGAFYIADPQTWRVRRVDAAGIITTVAGDGTIGNGGDGGAATSAQFVEPAAMAFDAVGNLYVADRGASRIRKVDVAGVISLFAGDSSSGAAGDGGPGTSASISSPRALALDALGNLYVATPFDHRVRRIDPAGRVATVAGDGRNGAGGDGGPATSAQLESPIGIALGPAGSIFISDASHPRIRRIDAAGVISTVAGTGVDGFGGDGGPATGALLSGPGGLAADALGNLYVADAANHRVRVIDAAGVIRTVAGTGSNGFGGDGGPATSALLALPQSVALDDAGNLFIADTFNHRVRRIDGAGIITTVAGVGTPGAGSGGGVAVSAQLAYPRWVHVDGQGNLFIADTGNHRICKVDAAGLISVVAGDVFPDPEVVRPISGDGGPAGSALLSAPWGIAVDAAGALYLADTDNDRVRRIAPDGIITTIAGRVDPENMGLFAQARLADPRALAVGPPSATAGMPSTLLIAGGGSGTVQAARVEAGWLEVVAGRYLQDVATGDLARYRDRSFGAVGGIAYDAASRRLYLTESSSHRVHVVTVVDPADATTWTMRALANPGGTAGFADGALAAARFRSPRGLYLDGAAGVLYVADTGNHVLRAIDLAAGTVRTVAGTPATRGFFGDGGAATDALLYAPEAVTRCGNGDVFVADTGNHRIRRLDASTGSITTVLGDGVAASSGEGRPASTFPVDTPGALACDSYGNLFVTSTSTVRMLPADGAGVVDGTGMVQTIYGEPPAQSFPASVTRCLTGLVEVDPGTLQVADSCTGLLVELHRERL